MAGAAMATAKVSAQQQQASSTKQATEEQLPLWRELIIGAALAYFVGSILLATVLYIATAVLIVTLPMSPWGWTLAAVVVSGSHRSASTRNRSASQPLFMLSCAPL